MIAMKRKPRIPRLLQAVLTVVGIYAGFVVIFDVILEQPIPQSLMAMYMFFVVAGVFMVYTFTEESAEQMVGPIKALVEDPSKKVLRNFVFVVVPLLGATFTYYKMQPSFEAPLELIVDCHCSRCRKGRSAAFASNLLVKRAAFCWLRGAERVRSYRVPGAKVFANAFCDVCGSVLPEVGGERDVVVVPAGGLDDDPGARERLHIFTGSKAPWYELPDDGLPRFEASPPQAP